MKTLKIILILVLFFTALTSCTEQALNEDTVLEAPPGGSIINTGGDFDN